jgi:anti-anti-sigma factor
MIEIVTLGESSIMCRPTGNLDLRSSFSLRHVVGDLLRPGLGLVVDLSRVAAIDGVGLSALVGTARRVRAFGGTMEIRNVSPRIDWLFDLVGLDRLLSGAFTGEVPIKDGKESCNVDDVQSSSARPRQLVDKRKMT